MNINYTPPPTCKEFMKDDSFFRAIMGPIGSGKSVTCVMEILRRCIAQPPSPNGLRQSRWAVIRNTRPQLKDTTLRTWFQWIPPGVLGTWKESEMVFTLKFNDVHAEILFRPLDSPDDVQRVLSLELTGAWINEAREIPLEILTAVQGRLRRYPRKSDVGQYWSGIIADTNPPEIDSTWYKILEHQPQNDDEPESIMPVASFIQPSGISPEAENQENLADGYYEQLAKGKTEEWVNVYIRGKYAKSQSGKPVYTKQFKYDKHVSRTPLPIDPNLPVIIGHDFGRTPAAVFMQQRYDGRIYILREAVGFDIGLKSFNTKFTKPIINNVFKNNPGVFVGDPAGVRQSDTDDNTCFKELKVAFPRTAGYHVKPAATNDPIVRINALGEALSQFPDGDPLVVIDPSCKWIIEGLRSKYRYAKKQGHEAYHEKPDKNNWSHVVEACQYAFLFSSTKYNISDYQITEISNNRVHHYRPADAYAGY
jgi:hypothetical protein